MEHLTKQQIVLLMMLVSFVTSIATGIVTVSLMGQNPVSVTQTINRVVEKTIERVVTDPNATSVTQNASVINAYDPAQAVERVSRSLVKIKAKGGGSDTISGSGIVVSNQGIVLTDKATLAPHEESVAVFANGDEFPLRVIQSQIDGDLVFALAVIPQEKKSALITPALFARSTRLGQVVLNLSGNSLDTLTQGLIEKIDSAIETSIPKSSTTIGSPLFSAVGEIIGFKTTSNSTNNSFYPLKDIHSIIPVISR